MDIKVLLLDMDGTTLEKNQVTISQRNMDAIDKAIEKGIYVIPCTGRVLDMFPPQILRTEKIRYCVTSGRPYRRTYRLSKPYFSSECCENLPYF